MVDKDLISKEKVEHQGLFDFPALYFFIHMLFKDEQYGVNEDRYVEKVKGNARNLMIEWKASKNLSDYFRIEHSVFFKIDDMTEVEVEIDGKKKKMNKGNISIELKGVLIKDRDSKWESGPFYKFLRDFYNKYIIPSRVDAMENRVSDDLRMFKEEIKKFLELSGKR